MIPGNRLTDVAHAIETGTRAAEVRYGRAFGIVEGYGGHGIGRQCTWTRFCPTRDRLAGARYLRRARCWPSNRC